MSDLDLKKIIHPEQYTEREKKEHSSPRAADLDLHEDVEKIQERNTRVETDKAWETSWVRILIIAGIIYIVAVLLLYSIDSALPFASAMIPAAGYLLSMQSLPFIKKWWIKKYFKSKK